MSKSQVDLAVDLLRDHFGETVATLGATLLREGHTTLQILAIQSRLAPGLIKQCVQILILHGLVSFTQNARGSVEFHCDVGRVLWLARFPWYLHTVKSLFGNLAELLVEELLSNGQLSLSECVRRVFRLAQSLEICKSVDEVVKKFTVLAETQFVKRCPRWDGESDHKNPILTVPVFSEFPNPFVMPEKINTKDPSDKSDSSGQIGKKRKRENDTETDANPDGDILWQVNFEKFHRFLRDQCIVSHFGSIYKEKSADVLRAFLRLNELRSQPGSLQSQPLSLNDVTKMVAESANLVQTQIEQYAHVFSDDNSQMMQKVGENAGGLFVIDFSNALAAIARDLLEDLVREKFGSRALRIFRLLLIKGYLEQSELENMAMLPSKEAKETTYQLLANGFISLKEVPKATDFAPSRTFYLFRVNLPQLARKTLDESFKALQNLILRRAHEIEENKALLERYERLEAVVANIQADEQMDDESKRQHLADVEQAYVSQAEKETLAQHRRVVARLQQAEVQLDQLLFALGAYLHHVPLPAPPARRQAKPSIV